MQQVYVDIYHKVLNAVMTNQFIAIGLCTIFIMVVYALIAQYGRTSIINYRIKNNAIEMVLFNIIPVRIVFIKDIVEIKKVSLPGQWAQGIKFFDDRVIILKKGYLFRNLFIFPLNSDEFVRQVQEEIKTPGSIQSQADRGEIPQEEKNHWLAPLILFIGLLVAVTLVMVYWYGYSLYDTFTVAKPGIKLPPHTYAVGKRPLGIAIDKSGNVWVTNYNSNTVTKLSSTGVALGTYKTGENPVGIAIDASGNVWVANNGSNSVTKLGPSGFIMGTYPAGKEPYGIAMDSSGNLWVTNRKNLSVTKLTSSGFKTGTYSIDNGWRSVLNGIVLDKDGNAWVTEQLNSLVLEVSPTGTHIGTYPVSRWPYGLAIDPSGNVWIACDTSVTELSSNGSNLGTYEARRLITGPMSVAVDASGYVWVSNIMKNNVIKFNPDGSIAKIYSIGGYHEGIAIDKSGNVWVTNVNGDSVSELVGVTKGPQYWPYKGPVFPGGGNF